MNIRTQSGSAIIYFVIIIAAIMSIGALGVEGARYIGKKARLGDALEAASIAVAVNDRVNLTFNKESAVAISDKWIDKYLPGNKGIDIEVSREEKNQKFGKDYLVTPYEIDYFHYDIKTRTTHNTWFNFSSWASFSKQQDVANIGSSARIKGSHQPVDIVFVADYSGSMNWKINNNDRYKKIEYLKRAVTGVTTKIHNVHKESTFAFIPFTKRIVVKQNDDYFCTSPLLATKNSPFDYVRDDPYFYSLLALGTKDEREIYYSNYPRRYGYQERLVAEYYVNLLRGRYYKNKREKYYKANDYYKEYLASIGKEWDSESESSEKFPSSKYEGTYKVDEPDQKDNIKFLGPVNQKYFSHIDIERSATEISLKRRYWYPMAIQYGLDYGSDAPYITRLCTKTRKGKPYFYTIERQKFDTEEQLKNFNSQINSMKASGGTDMYQGLLAAPNEFDGAKNKNRYIIVLSDGVENGNNFKKLVDKGLCDNIKTALSENGKYNSKLFVVGIGLNQSKSPAYKRCFKENIITVYDPEELEKRIMGIITDDDGHNFDRY